MKKYDTIVIGAGAIGLAVARVLSREGREVLVLEKESSVGEHLSSRGSAVIHSGIYYPAKTLKALLCVKGRKMLYEYCKEMRIPHQKIGKLIVATCEDEEPLLLALKKRAEDNDVHDLQTLSGNEVKAMEPKVLATAGLFSPSTGILDPIAYMHALTEDIEEHRGEIRTEVEVMGGRILDDGVELTLADKDTIRCKTLINCGSLSADAIARSIEGFPKERIPTIYYAKGNYFRFTGASPFSHLVYPVPVPGGLGVHATLNVKGEVRFGPDVVWDSGMDYTIDASRESEFYTSIRKYFPSLIGGSLVPDHASVRPKLVPRGVPDADFLIQGPRDHGVANIVNLFGIESPGLTASLAIGEHVRSML